MRASKRAYLATGIATFVIAMPATAGVPKGDQQVTLNGETQENHDLSKALIVEQPGSPYGYASTSASRTPFVTAIVATGEGKNVATRAGLDYWLAINGPAFTGTIPVVYQSTLRVNASGLGANEGSSASSEFVLQSYSVNPDGSIYRNLTNQQWSVEASSRYGSGANSKVSNIRGVFNLDSGNVLLTAIIADVRAQDGGRAAAFADPYFFIDPTFATDHPGYTLSLSPFAGNDAPVGGVPEPTMWALMIAGFGLTGVALRHRSRSYRAT